MSHFDNLPRFLYSDMTEIFAQFREEKDEWFDQIWQGWADFIDQYHWNSFHTITFRDPWSIKAISKSLRRFGEKHTIYESLSPAFIFFVEPHKSGLMHVHGLTRNEKHDRFVIWKDAFERYGRAKITSYIENYGGNNYISKYCSKNRTEIILDERKK